MSCNIVKNKNQAITGVLDQNDNDSKLFRNIIANPHLNVEEAIDVYKNIFTPKFQKNEQTGTTELGKSRGDRARWNPARGNQTLEGAPNIQGATGADARLTSVAEEYAREKGINYRRQSQYVEVDIVRAERIAQAYDEMEHAPQDPKVKEAFQNLIEQTTAQYRALEEAGYKFFFFDETNDPYQGNPWNAMRDLRANQTMGSFATEAGFGTGNEGLDVSDNPMLQDTGITWGWGSVDGQPKRVLAKDLFRAVHDAFGHGLEGAGFRARGEENAWQAHARLFTGSALGAITSETRGQNSWLNFGKYGEQNRTAKVEDTIFAPQKTGLMPEWTWKEGFDEGKQQNISAEEPTLTYQNPQGEVFTSFSEALKATESGEVTAYLDNEEVFSIDSDSNEDTYGGMINHLIKEGILTGRQILDKDGRLIQITEGASEVKKIITAQIAEETAIKTLGRNGVTQTKSSDIVFQKSTVGARTVYNKKGEAVETTQTELQEQSFEELQSKYDDPEVLLGEQEYRNFSRAFSGKKILEEAQEFIPENELQASLIDLLHKLGIKTTSIEAYKEAYAKKNGVEPSAQALADISNKIIAFLQGEITQDTLTEELSHFIVEASEQAEIEDLLRNIHKTQEWAEYSEQYRPLYETEDQLRREILGKVLSNAIQQNFATENRVGIEQNIIQRIQQLFVDFFNRIGAFFKPQYAIDLETYTQQIYNNLMARELYTQLNTEQLEGNKLVMYSAENTVKSPLDIIYQNASKALDVLDSQSRNIAKSTSKSQIQESRALINKTDTQATIKALSGIVRVAKNHTRYLQNAVKKNAQKTYPFSQEEQVVYTTTIGTLLGQLQQIKRVLDVKDKTQKQILAELEQTISDIGDLKAQKDSLQINVWEKHVDRMVQKHNLNPEQRDTLMKYYDGVHKDTNWFFMHVSSMVHAQDPLLNAAADIVSRMTTNSTIRSNRRTKKLLNNLEKLGVNPQSLKKFKRGSYIFNPYDYGRMEIELNAEKARLYSEIKGEVVSVDEFLELEKKEELNLSIEEQQDFYEGQRKFEADTYRVDVLTKEARDKKNALLERFSKATQRFDRDLSRQRGNISREAEELGEYTQDHRFGLEEINKQRQKAKSPFDVDGKLKKGLLIKEDGSIVKDPSYTTLEAESQLTLELNELDALRFADFKDKLGEAKEGIPELFLQKLRSKPASEQFEFLQLNANMSFSNEFWDTLTSKSSIIERLEGVNEQSDELTELISDIKKAQVKRSYLLKQNRVYNQPSETSQDISQPDMESIKEIEEYLGDKYNEANKYLPKEEFVEDEFAENNTNEAYKGEILDRSLVTVTEQVEFIRKHVTPTNVKRIDAASVTAEKIIRGTAGTLSKANERIFDTANYSENEVERRAQVERDLLKFAESRLLPYYKRLEPVGFTDILGDIEAGVLTTEQFLENYENGQYPYLNITPNYIFEQEVDNDNLNPEYLENQKYGRPQIKKEYRNAEYADYFGEITYTENEDGSFKPQAQKNTQDFEALQALMDYHKGTLEATNMMDRHNPYLLPQRGMRGFRQWQELASGLKASTFKELWKDATSFREDEKEYGEGTDGTSLGAKQGEMIIPKYGFNKLENQEDVTDELLESYTWMGHEAEVYKSRLEAFADMEAIKSLILEKQYGAKKGAASNVYKMFDSFYKFNIYGQNETFSYETDLFGILSKKQNLAPLAKKFQWWIRLVNLGFSLIVPLTSLLQGGTNLLMEKWVGERIDKDASRLTNKKVGKYLSGAVGDSLAFNTKSKLNSVAEYFGVFSVQERFNNSNYNRFTRGLLKSSFLTHTIGDAPIKTKVILTVLHDFRVADGSIQNYQQFRGAQQLMDANLSEKEIREKWRKTEDNVFFDYLDTINGITEINTKKLAEDLGQDENSESFKDYVELKTQSIRDAMNTLTTETDTMIPQEQKSIAQRHAIFSFFFLHRGWMVVAYNRKFKNRHMNPYTGLQEEGNWMGTANFLKDMIKEARNPNKTQSFMKHMKETWENSDDTSKRSLHRTAVEIMVTSSMGVLALVLMGLADDKDPKGEDFLLQFSAYMGLRTSNEVISSTVALPAQVFSFMEAPTVGIDKIKNMADILDLTSSDMVRQGRFKGVTERERFIYKNYPLVREAFNLSRMSDTRKTYLYHNKENLQFPWVWSTYLMSQDEN